MLFYILQLFASSEHLEWFSKELVLKLNKFNVLLVSKLSKLIVFKLEQRVNINSIDLTLLALKELKIAEVNEIQPMNIPVKSV